MLVFGRQLAGSIQSPVKPSPTRYSSPLRVVGHTLATQPRRLYESSAQPTYSCQQSLLDVPQVWCYAGDGGGHTLSVKKLRLRVPVGETHAFFEMQ